MARIRAKARIRESTTTAGTGPYTLAGAVDNSHNSFASMCANGDTIEVTVVEPAVAFWTGLATFNTGPNRITLTAVEETSGTFGAGTKEIFAGPLASGISPVSLPVTGGSGSAYTLTSSKPVAVGADGFTVSFTPGATNTGAVTLAVDGGTARPLRFLTGVDLPPNVLISGSLYQATYRAGSTEWLLHAMDSSIFSIPIGGIIDYAGLLAPNGLFALPQGQAISTTTFATLFALVGTTYNTGGEPGGTFRLPDMVGRMGAMRDVGSARLSSTYFGGNPANLGAVGGSESSTLLTGNLPAYTPAGGVTNGQVKIGASSSLTYATQNSIQYATTAGSQVGAVNQTQSITQDASSFSGTPQGGTSTPVRTVPPMIILNKIIRVL